MAQTIVEQLAEFTVCTDYSKLPAKVVEESKRLLLDAIACAVAAVDEPKGKAGIEFARLMGGKGNATIIGTGDKVNVVAAAYANGELINTLDWDAVLPPGHVTPYVLPGALAVAEDRGASGKELIAALAVAHEMTHRIGKAMDNLRDTKDGKVNPPVVFGYAENVFGAAASIAKLKGLSRKTIEDAIGIAGLISPVNPQVAWFQHAPSSTVKYLMAGALTNAAMTAAHAAEFGHRGDKQILDDREFGYPRYIGTSRWEPQHITANLGTEWLFPDWNSIKPYPHCRILHALLDTLIEMIEKHDIKPAEIEGIKVWVEGMVERPVWLNRDIQHVQDAQFSIAHGIALGAHRVKPGKAWQDPKIVFSSSVLDLMKKVTHVVHPDYVKLLTSNGASRPAKVELKARGTLFVGERRYPKGSPSPEPASYMTNDELVAKFRSAADGVIPPRNVDRIVEACLGLEKVDDVRTFMSHAAKG